jgi:hypothetical protein
VGLPCLEGKEQIDDLAGCALSLGILTAPRYET